MVVKCPFKMKAFQEARLQGLEVETGIESPFCTGVNRFNFRVDTYLFRLAAWL